MKLILFLAALAALLVLIGLPAHGANFRWASTSDRIYVENGGSATLTDIKTALPNAPLDLVDPANKVWLLRANLQIADGCSLLLYGSEVGGDVNQLYLQSNNSTNFGAFVGIIADWGTLDIRRTRISSWDSAVNGPDTEFQTFGRAYIRVRSRLAADGITPLESRMDILDSDISYLGYEASESYGLSWKVIGTHPDPSKSIFDYVKVYGDIKNSRIHHNFWAVYTFGLKNGAWLSNELDHNLGYGFDLHDDSDHVVIQDNNVHHNGGVARGLHGIIASRRCDHVTIRNNRSWANAGNGIMVHRHSDDCLIENNDSFLNGDSGVAVFDSDRTIVRNNLIMSNGNAGIRLSVGAADNHLDYNEIGYSGKNGLYYFSGTDPGEPDLEDPTVTVRLRRNTAASNYIHHCSAEGIKIGDSDDNLFIGNAFEANGPELAVWTSTLIRFIGNSIPPTATVKMFGSLSLTNATTNVTTTAFFLRQPVVKLALADALTSATFQDERGAIFDFDKTELATRVNSAGAAATVTQAQIGGGTTATMRNLFVSLSGGEARVNPTLWTQSGDFRKQWMVQPSSATTSIRYTVGDLPPNTTCTILKNGQPLTSGLSDASGSVRFADVPGTTSAIQFSAFAGGQPPSQPTVTIVATDASASETAPNPATFTITRTGASTNVLLVRYSTGGTAINGTDYSALPGSITIPAGSLSAVLTVSPINDTVVESNETVVITLTTNAAYVVGTPGSATATIADNDQPPTQPTVTIVASDASASETAPNPATFTVTRTGSTATGLTVRYATGGTAVNGTDYTSLPGTMTIPAGSSSAILVVSPINDTTVESNETVVITLAIDPAYVIGSPSSATATIADNDQPPTQPTVSIVASDASASETESNPATFTVSRTGSTATALAVRYSIGGTAVNGTDYTALPGSATISAGSVSTVITVNPIDDTEVEGNETVVIALTNDPAYVIGSPSSAAATIADNDQPPTQPAVTIVASDGGASETAPDTATFTVTRTGSTATALAVRYSVGGTAANGTDFAALSGSLSIPAGSPSAVLTVNPIDDTVVEGNETVVVTLATDAGYTMGSPSSATVTIADNDQAPPSLPTVTVIATDATSAERDHGNNRGRFTFTRTGSTTAALVVRYSIGGTAVNGTDYATLSGSVTILSGKTAASVNVIPIGDAAVEGNETVEVTLAADAAYAIGSQNTATVTIIDNAAGGGSGTGGNRPTISVTASDASGSESGPNPATFTFTRTGSIDSALTFRYAVGGTAANGIDYVALSGALSFAAGSSTRVLTITPIDDAFMEGDETVVLTVAADTAYNVGSPNSATVTIGDNDQIPTAKPMVSVMATDLIASESGPDAGTFTISRSGSTAAALTVHYSLSGTAINGTDYQALPGSVTIPAGATSAEVVVRPIDDNLVEVGEVVILSLDPSPSYDVLLNIAVLTILDNDLLLP